MKSCDQLQREIELPNSLKRIVSLVPSQTELLVELGLETSIVGITKFCVHPNYLRNEKTVVGGTKQVDFKKIRTLQPDIILCNKEENTKEMITELEQIAPVHISDIYTIKDCLELIDMYGNLFSVEEKSSQIILSIESEAEKFSTYISKMPKLKVTYFIWREPWMVAGSKTFINHLLELNNFENTFSELERYPEINLEAIEQKNVDVILLSSEPYPFTQKHIDEISNQVLNAKIKLVNGEYFSWYGSRLSKAFDYFTKLHKELE